MLKRWNLDLYTGYKIRLGNFVLDFLSNFSVYDTCGEQRKTVANMTERSDFFEKTSAKIKDYIDT